MKLTIGKLAKQAEVTIATIRYYHRIGLLDEPKKPSHGFRHYPNQAITRLQFIKHAQKAGFSLKEIAELLSFDGSHCADVKKITEQKCQKIDVQISDLMALRQLLTQLANSCEQSEPSSKQCAILDTFAKTTVPETKS